MSKRPTGRRPRFETPLTSARNLAARLLARPLLWFRPATRFVVGFLALTLTTTLLLSVTRSQAPADFYQEGDVVRSDVISPADFTVEDEEETARRRAVAAESAPPVWHFDPLRADASAQSFRASWEAFEVQVSRRSRAGTRNSDRNANSNANAEQADLVWPGVGDRRAVARVVVRHMSDPGLLERLTRMIRESGEGYIYDEGDAAQIKREIRLVNTLSGAATSIVTAQNRLVTLGGAREALRGRISQISGWSRDEQETLADAMMPLLAPSIVFDRAATEATREAAANSVPRAAVTLKRNQIVAREHDTVTPQMLAQFAAIRQYGRSERRPHLYVGLFLIAAALYAAAWRFVEYRSTTTTLPLSRGRAFTLVASAILVQLVLMRTGLLLAQSISSQAMAPPWNDPVIWSFAVPFAAAALLVAILVDTQLALITGVLTAVFAGLIAPNGMLMSCYALISSSAAIYGIGRYRERQSVTLAGLGVGIVNALVALAVMLAAQQPLTLNSALLAMGCGLLGGLLTTIFTAGGLPVNESAFGILTDVKLLELSNADLPVLGQLAIRAPGTNQHSHAVGRLSEEACRAIGANALLARIGALYHDIGKLAAPDMFVENQAGGTNPHDRLRPTQSARIITSHVTYGLKLAKEIGLPKQISDFIPQHHGTRTLHFFLRKAQAHAAEGETVDESEFRYPGPKPQFKEAAVMMLADSCEAAARSLARPDPENIRAIVSKIFDAILSDGQLDECDLTLREVTRIRETIIISLTALYHARIDYPGFNPPSLDPTKAPLPPADIDSEERGIGFRRPSEVPISKGGEVEDEALTTEGKR
ncbi:MAG TPA: HDIG domain-containing protein [Pyrinomonadaceae bacterium]|nr:HDIG domain-containing protein [Pyrinomonadaceae bacterium]